MPSDVRERSPFGMVTLDLEGVLTPEVWIAVAETTGIAGLRRTTRDEPDYDVLMAGRLALLNEHGLTMSAITDVIGALDVLPGAKDFLDRLRDRAQVVILSDTFEQFAAPLMRQLGMPTILCHSLVVTADRIVDYRLRQQDQKRNAVEAFQALNYCVVAAGDSYNDASMLCAADAGIWFRSPEAIITQFPQFAAVDTYDDLFDHLVAALGDGTAGPK